MGGFIEIKSKKGKRLYINIKHIELVSEVDDGCVICMAFNCTGTMEQDYEKTDMSYDEIVSMIKKGGASDA